MTYYLQIVQGIVVGYSTDQTVFPIDSQVVEIELEDEPINILGTTY